MTEKAYTWHCKACGRSGEFTAEDREHAEFRAELRHGDVIAWRPHPCRRVLTARDVRVKRRAKAGSGD